MNLFLWFDYAVMSAEVHECEEAQQSIVVGIEVAIVKGLVLGIPEGINKLLLLGMIAENGGGGNGTYQADAVAQLAETTCGQNLILLGQ